MEKLPMCRICLTENFRMYVVENKQLHELYERLTDIPPKPLINQDHLEVSHGFIISPIESISIVEVDQTESIVVKEELPANCERQDDILEPKEDDQCYGMFSRQLNIVKDLPTNKDNIIY